MPSSLGNCMLNIKAMPLIVTEIIIYSKTLTKNFKTPKFCNFVKNSKSKTPKFIIKKYIFLQKYPGNVLPRSLGSCM